MGSITISWWILFDILATAEFLLEAFDSLGRRSLDPEQVDALRVPGRSGALVGVSGSREQFLLLSIDPTMEVSERRLRAISVGSGDSYTVHESATGAVVSQRFAVVRLRHGNDDLATSFALVAATLLATMSDTPKSDEIAEFLDSLVRLLASPRNAAPATVSGLWGELWVIASVPNPDVLALGWHSDPNDRFDFGFPSCRLEIKTTMAAARVHDFSLDQLEREEAKPTWIGSLRVVRDPSGRSVIDLLEQVVSRVPAHLAARVTRIALETLSGDIESAQDFQFEPIGPSPLLTYRADDVPRVTVPAASGISAIRFRVDLGLVVPVHLSLNELAQEVSS